MGLYDAEMKIDNKEDGGDRDGVTTKGTQFQFPSRIETEVQFLSRTGYYGHTKTKMRLSFRFVFGPIRCAKPYENETEPQFQFRFRSRLGTASNLKFQNKDTKISKEKI
jgi:hypothetical protein